MEYNGSYRFNAIFLDENAKPLSKTGIIFILDGITQPIITTDVNGLAVLDKTLSLGTHTITSINTITNENMTNYVVVVSDINSIINVEDINNVNYGQNPLLTINVGSNYLNADIEIKIEGDNGYNQSFTQKATKRITKQLIGLNAGKYTVNVVYHGSEGGFVINLNKTFNVLKIDPSAELIVLDYYTDSYATIRVNVANSNGTVTLKVGSRSYNEKLTNGVLVKSINGFAIGDYNVEALFEGDNNYNPKIMTSIFKMCHNFNFNDNFPSILLLEEKEVYEEDEGGYTNQEVTIYNLIGDENDSITLFIDGNPVRLIDQYTIIDDDNLMYCIKFSPAFLSEGNHSWEIRYSNLASYVVGIKSGSFNAYYKKNYYDIFNFGLNTDKTFNSIKTDEINWNIKEGTYDDGTYSISTFVYNGSKYNIINSLGYATGSNPVFVEFNPNDYTLFDGSFYRIENGFIREVIENYQIFDGVYYKFCGFGSFTSSLDEFAQPFYYLEVIDGKCYKYLGFYIEAIKNVDYKIINGKYYYMNNKELEVYDSQDWTIINGTKYYIEGNYYNAILPPVDDLILINGSFYHVVTGDYDEEIGDYKNYYVINDGKLFLLKNGVIGSQIQLKQQMTDKDINIPELPGSSGGSVTVKLPSDASGTITLNINSKDYNFVIVNGVANVKVPELANGKYMYTITYSGDDRYSSFSKDGSLTVNNPSQKTNPSSPTSDKKVTKTTLTLKKVTVKRSAKKLTIQATLKINGKAGNGKYIKFKFNKKTYKAKTNAKGVAKITVKKTVLKKLKVGKKITYTATYGKITKKVTIKVKK